MPPILAAPALSRPHDFAGGAKLAVAWATGLQFFRDVVQFALTLALVRLLPTDAYGQFGLMTSLLTFFTYYSFREFLGHTLQVRDGDEVHYQDHFTAGAVIQAAIVVAVNAVAVAFRWFPDYAPISPVLHVMSLLFVIDLPAEFRTRMLERSLDWRRLRLLQAGGFLAGGLASLAMALSGLGVWALIVPTLLVPLPFVWDLFVTQRWRPTWAFSWDRYRPAWRFGLTRVTTLTLLAVAAIAESLTLAGALGFAALGIFGRAIGLAQLLCGRLASLLAIAIYPVLTRVERSSDAYRRAAGLYLRAVTWCAIPAAVVAALIADPIVRIVYGRQWLAAIPLVPLAMAGAAIAAVAQTAYTILLANGQQRACVVADASRMVGVLLALALALPAGPDRYLAALSLVHLVGLAVVSRASVQTGALERRSLVDALLPPFVGSAIAMLAVAAPAYAFVPLFAVLYVGALRIVFPKPFAELVWALPQSHAIARVLRFSTSS